LQTVGSRGMRGFVFEREMHAFMSAVLLRMTGPDWLLRPSYWRI